MGALGCSETSVSNYKSTLCRILVLKISNRCLTGFKMYLGKQKSFYPLQIQLYLPWHDQAISVFLKFGNNLRRSAINLCSINILRCWIDHPVFNQSAVGPIAMRNERADISWKLCHLVRRKDVHKTKTQNEAERNATNPNQESNPKHISRLQLATPTKECGTYRRNWASNANVKPKLRPSYYLITFLLTKHKYGRSFRPSWVNPKI
jgi:hypothetical protein